AGSSTSRRSMTVTFYRPGSISTMWPPGDAASLHSYPAGDDIGGYSTRFKTLFRRLEVGGVSLGFRVGELRERARPCDPSCSLDKTSQLLNRPEGGPRMKEGAKRRTIIAAMRFLLMGSESEVLSREPAG